MIEEIAIKFGTELKPTQYSWKSQLYNSLFIGQAILLQAELLFGENPRFSDVT